VRGCYSRSPERAGDEVRSSERGPRLGQAGLGRCSRVEGALAAACSRAQLDDVSAVYSHRGKQLSAGDSSGGRTRREGMSGGDGGGRGRALRTGASSHVAEMRSESHCPLANQLPLVTSRAPCATTTTPVTCTPFSPLTMSRVDNFPTCASCCARHHFILCPPQPRAFLQVFQS
jgi:hypothetical protein